MNDATAPIYVLTHCRKYTVVMDDKPFITYYQEDWLSGRDGEEQAVELAKKLSEKFGGEVIHINSYEKGEIIPANETLEEPEVYVKKALKKHRRSVLDMQMPQEIVTMARLYQNIKRLMDDFENLVEQHEVMIDHDLEQLQIQLEEEIAHSYWTYLRTRGGIPFNSILPDGLWNNLCTRLLGVSREELPEPFNLNVTSDEDE